MFTRKGRPLAKSVEWPPPPAIVVHAAAWKNVASAYVACPSWHRTVTLCGGRCIRGCSAPAAAGAPLSQEAVSQQDATPGAASLSARQEVTEVEAPVFLAPRQQGAQEDRFLP